MLRSCARRAGEALRAMTSCPLSPRPEPVRGRTSDGTGPCWAHRSRERRRGTVRCGLVQSGEPRHSTAVRRPTGRRHRPPDVVLGAMTPVPLPPPPGRPIVPDRTGSCARGGIRVVEEARSRAPRQLACASPFALLLLALAVGTATANHQQGHLSDPSVAPRQVAAGATVTVAVTSPTAPGLRRRPWRWRWIGRSRR